MIEKTAFYLNRKDEEPNTALARELAETGNDGGIREMIEGLDADNPSLAGDCIKVLYETARLKPELVAGYAGVFVKKLKSRNNRLVWGSMYALAEIVSLKPEEVFAGWDTLLSVYAKGSVITVDAAIRVFAGLVRAGGSIAETAWPVLLTHLENCRAKEVGQHAESVFACVDPAHAPAFRAVLEKRREFLSAPQMKRVDKLLHRIEKGQFVG